ncbi:hypothetical protein [Burkholderia cepacia]|uniref:hypothetical protein n=1 Tax=Burkholderia cepacia TaxID=292 RepID=UPI001575978B|nr:hypothetical protein [Burkholderia cepacia]
MTNHTEGKLELGRFGVVRGGPVHHYTNGSGRSQLFLATAGQDMSHEEIYANAARLVKCWNLHDELVAALKALRDEAAFSEEFGNTTKAEFDAICAKADAVLAEAEA